MERAGMVIAVMIALEDAEADGREEDERGDDRPRAQNVLIVG